MFKSDNDSFQTKIFENQDLTVELLEKVIVAEMAISPGVNYSVIEYGKRFDYLFGVVNDWSERVSWNLSLTDMGHYFRRGLIGINLLSDSLQWLSDKKLSDELKEDLEEIHFFLQDSLIHVSYDTGIAFAQARALIVPVLKKYINAVEDTLKENKNLMLDKLNLENVSDRYLWKPSKESFEEDIALLKETTETIASDVEDFRIKVKALEKAGSSDKELLTDLRNAGEALRAKLSNLAFMKKRLDSEVEEELEAKAEEYLPVLKKIINDELTYYKSKCADGGFLASNEYGEIMSPKRLDKILRYGGFLDKIVSERKSPDQTTRDFYKQLYDRYVERRSYFIKETIEPNPAIDWFKIKLSIV